MMILINGGKLQRKVRICGDPDRRTGKERRGGGGIHRKIDARRRRKTDMRHQPSCYLATMIAWDEECRERIRKHRKMREKKNFITIECPVDLSKAEVPARSRCLLECVSNLAANEMYRRDMEDPENGADGTDPGRNQDDQENSDFLVIVTNDVSGDQGPYSEETEEYRKLLGRINCALAREADEVYEVICGEPVMVKKKKREDTEVEERRTDRSVDRQRGIRLFVGGAYQGKSNLAMREAVTEENRFILVADGEQSPLEDAFDSEAVLNLHIYIRRLIDAVLGEYDGKREGDRVFCDSIRSEINERTEAVRDPAERTSAGETKMVREQTKETENIEIRIEEVMYRYLDMILEKNPNAVITCDEIGCGIVPIDKTDRLWREMSGDACQYLAARAVKVCRVVCGIPMALKGGET